MSVALDCARLKTLFFDKGRQSERLQHLHAQAQMQGVEIKPLQRQGWNKVLPSDLHQGVAGSPVHRLAQSYEYHYSY